VLAPFLFSLPHFSLSLLLQGVGTGAGASDQGRVGLARHRTKGTGPVGGVARKDDGAMTHKTGGVVACKGDGGPGV
jgi:hypothetical protein